MLRLFAISSYHFGIEAFDKRGVFGNFCFAEVNVYFGRLPERFVTSGIVEQEVSHDDMAGLSLIHI